MKRIYALIVMLLAAIPCMAQIDIATLDGKTPDEVIKMFGTPVDQDRDRMDYDCDAVLIYKNCKIYLDKVYNNDESLKGYTLCAFETDSPSFCILSDVYPGGIKVGDKAADLEKFDFANCKYGNHRTENNFTKIHATEYILFKERYEHYYFTVQDGIIKSITLSQAQDWYPEVDLGALDGVGLDVIREKLLLDFYNGGEYVPEELAGQPGIIDIDLFGTHFYLDKSSNKILGMTTSFFVPYVLSDIIPGGLKVGDSVDRLKSYDYINSKYGHGDFGNDLKHLRENYYGLFLKEWGKYYFTIAKGKISKIEFISTTLSNLR
ncbi:MAG: hypothetical protein J6X63_01800 [Bacteroidales bacterium]|nr:hypothetical protein [Bacteroidales bacterium]